MSSNIFNWRERLGVHPACESYPLLPENELNALAEDIKTHGLRVPIVTWSPEKDAPAVLLDGRNRLDALALLGVLYSLDGNIALKTWTGTTWAGLSGDRIKLQRLVGGDPGAIARSLNVRRRHLTRDAIAKAIAANPEKSNYAIAEQMGVSEPTVRRARTASDDAVDTRVGRDGVTRRLPTARPPAAVTDFDTPDDTAEDDVEASAENRKTAAVTPKAVISAKDTALHEFDAHVLRLVQMTSKAKAGRFAKTSVPAADLSRLAAFLKQIADTVEAQSAVALDLICAGSP